MILKDNGVVISQFYPVTWRFIENIFNIVLPNILNSHMINFNIEFYIHFTYMIQLGVVNLINKEKVMLKNI